MIKILIVDDDASKIRKICSVILKNKDVNEESVHSCNHLVVARRFLESHRYDLLILDLQVPNRPTDPPENDAGEKFLEEIHTSNRLQKPFHIIGMTAFDGLYKAYSSVFNRFLWHLFYFQHSSADWEGPLASKIEYLTNSKRNIQTSDILEYDYDLAIVTATTRPELAAVHRLAKFEEVACSDDSTVYHKAIFPGKSRNLRVVSAVAPQMGMPASSVLTLKLIERFRPKCIAMVGIAAGIPNVVNFGDIVVADQTFDYGSGKILIDRKQVRQFKPDPRQIALEPALKERFMHLELNRSYLDEIAKNWSGLPAETPLKVVVGGIASGAAVVQDPKILDVVLRSSRKVVAIDMETYGVFYSATNCRGVKPKVLSIKSISDFADTKKHDNFHPYASYTSASYLYHFAINTL